MLKQQNVDVTVIEISNGGALGASVAINNRAVDTLQSLGVLNECIEAGTAFDSNTSIYKSMFDAAGNPLPMPAPPGRPDDSLPASIQMYRPTFAKILTDKAKSLGVVVKTNISFDTINEVSDGLSVKLTDGSHEKFDLVIGADGIQSKVRSGYIDSDTKPAFTQSTAIRWMHSGKLEGKSGFYNHSDGKTVVVNVELPNNFYYFLTAFYGPTRHVEQDEARSIVQDVLSKFSAPRLTHMKNSLSSDHRMMVNPFYWLLVPRPWHKGRVALVGDAAHATTANLGYGAGLALEDAVVLGEEFARHNDIDSALLAYEKRRYERVRMVVETSVALMELAVTGASAEKSGRLRFEAYTKLMEAF